MTPRLVILSGGAESVALAVAEAAWRSRTPYAVISLVPHSVLEGLDGCVAYRTIWSPGFTPALAAERLCETIIAMAGPSAGGMLHVFPTEDDGLRVLHACRSRLTDVAVFSRSRALELGGLDKAELFQALQNAGLESHLAPTLPLDSLANLDHVLDRLGHDAVIKPAYKPWQSSLGASGLKVISASGDNSDRHELRARLYAAWHLSDRWIAQARLGPLRGYERSACVVRSDGVVRGCEVVERLKHPQMGGSAVLVSTSRSRALMPIAQAIAEAIDLQGICEMTFLADDRGEPRLLELNTRPWLQLELLERSGYPIVRETMCALAGVPLEADFAVTDTRDWIQIERLLLALLSCRSLQRLRAILNAFTKLFRRPIVAVWSSELPGVRRRWLTANFRRLSRAIGM